MIPDIELRLDSVRRALTEVILPAIDGGNTLAVEQTMLAIGHVGMIIDQVDKVGDFIAICRADLAQAMADLPTAEGPRTTAAAEALAAALSRKDQSSRESYRAASAALEQLIRVADSDGDTAFRCELHRRVLGFTKRQATRERAWFAASGFDPAASNLPSIAAMISAEQETLRGS